MLLSDYCKLLDCVILRDREDIDDVYPSYRFVYALGKSYEDQLTPYFPSQDELLTYCQQNIINKLP